jgi:hypothetical protein
MVKIPFGLLNFSFIKLHDILITPSFFKTTHCSFVINKITGKDIAATLLNTIVVKLTLYDNT